MAKKILIPTDGSEQAKDASRLALQMAGKLGLDLIALRVVDVERYASEFMAVREAVSAELEEQARRILEETSAIAREAGMDIDTQVRHGDSSREIIRFAQEHPDVVLIVMGASGRRRLGRQLIGSTAERVVRQVGRDLPCAVTIAPSVVTTPEARLEF
ncbi:MAG: universal stress protein [Thermoleophilia bacterium]|nr:universal stress protein [Thermoleophilia bacterium]